MDKKEKSFRLLELHEVLNKGAFVSKTELANLFYVSEKTIQRDIDELRAYLAEKHEADTSICYDKSTNSYMLFRSARDWLTNEEVLAVCKIILESRAFPRVETKSLVDKLLLHAAPKEQEFVRHMLKSELVNFVELKHKKNLLPLLWNVSRLIHGKEITTFDYTRTDNKTGERKTKPVAVLFYEFYFYLLAYPADDERADTTFPIVYRLDRIRNIKGTGELFVIPYDKKFSEGEFRQRAQFMHPGPLLRITFKFNHSFIDNVLDRLPTARVIEENDGTYVITAEVYGRGIDIWLRSQGELISDLKMIELPSRSVLNN